MTKHHAPPCQSCGMPLRAPRDHGTDVGGRRDEDYCHHCFREGLFTQPSASLDEMIGRMAACAEELKMSEDEALAHAQRLLPTLKRWRDSTP